MSKNVVFTSHALDAIRERQIEVEWVKRTVFAPEWREPDDNDPAVSRCFRSIPERGGRYLRVACVETETEFRIVSALLDRRARPK